MARKSLGHRPVLRAVPVGALSEAVFSVLSVWVERAPVVEAITAEPAVTPIMREEQAAAPAQPVECLESAACVSWAPSLRYPCAIE